MIIRAALSFQPLAFSLQQFDIRAWHPFSYGGLA